MPWRGVVDLCSGAGRGSPSQSAPFAERGEAARDEGCVVGGKGLEPGGFARMRGTKFALPDLPEHARDLRACAQAEEDNPVMSRRRLQICMGGRHQEAT